MHCNACQRPVEPGARFCRHCGAPVPVAPPMMDDSTALIPLKNPLALTAYYCGVFAVIPCLGLLLGPPAFALGIAGLRAYRREPRVHGLAHAWVGIILGALTGGGNLLVLVLMLIAAQS